VGLSPSTAAGLNQLGSWNIGNAELLALGLLSIAQILVTCCLLAMTRYPRNMKMLGSTTIWWVIIIIGVIALAQIATLTTRPNGIVLFIGTMTALFAAFGTLAAFPEYAPWPMSAVLPLHFSDAQSDAVSDIPNDSERLRSELAVAHELNASLQRQMTQLTRDVTHRTKNVLAVVHAIARQTAARAPNEFLENFGDRVQSLARSHDLLVKQDWRGVDLVELIHAQLADQSGLIGTRILLSGPAVTLGPEARKHGVLSGPDGTVSIEWHFVGPAMTPDAAPVGQALSLSWTEQGGNVRPSHPTNRTKAGFGRSFLETAVGRTLDGRAKLEILPRGLVYEIVIPSYHMV
jgi:two-component sensor histidine kinase